MGFRVGDLRQLLSQISGCRIGDHDYVSYFENEHGEQLIFVREPRAKHGVLLHSDLAVWLKACLIASSADVQ
ncbi:hypothetical protein [Catenulispora acidiphila]|uniref:hypothetical protein n=1 Tax=Catenulispora acidiphila TaxID=304895 RepID=UPI0011816281|nr:hypothetical protein [Catenulispora acidiphila]